MRPAFDDEDDPVQVDYTKWQKFDVHGRVCCYCGNIAVIVYPMYKLIYAQQHIVAIDTERIPFRRRNTLVEYVSMEHSFVQFKDVVFHVGLRSRPRMRPRIAVG